MAVPYVPTPFATPIVSPAVGSSGAPAIPYISNSEFNFAPTAIDANHLYPGGTVAQNIQTLADTIRRASRWCDSICFGEDPAGKGSSLAASLTVQSATVAVKGGELRLICDYRPLVQVVGVAVGSGMADLAPLDATTASLIRTGRRVIYVPYGGPFRLSGRNGQPVLTPNGSGNGALYAVWSYVSGYPHTKLAASVAANATTCVVDATDGNGGLWGVFPGAGAFPGTQLTVVDGANTEAVFVQSVAVNTPSTGQATLTTSAFQYAHTLPASPDFVPVSAVPDDVHQAVISLTTALIKVRGARAMVMGSIGGAPTKQAMVQAGALEDYEIAEKILSDGGYRVRVRSTGSY